MERYLFEHQVDLSKPKKTVYDEIYHKNYNRLTEEIPFGDLPTDLEPTDLIVIHQEKAYYSENDSHGDITTLTVHRPRLETDEEYNDRLVKSQEFINELKEKRYQTYLKLKLEFENHEDKNLLP